MAAKMNKELPQTMLNYLHKHYTTDEPFTAPVLYPIAKKHSPSHKSCANNILRNLINAGCVIRTDQTAHQPHGGSDMPLYYLTGETEFKPVRTKTKIHYDGIAQQLAKMNAIQLELHARLDGMVRGSVNHEIGATA